MPRTVERKNRAAKQPDKSLILSIDKIHSERIFSGEKRFELRKKLPKQKFNTVYLYENGNTGIVGAFSVGKIHHLPVDELWAKVGEKATPKDRFFRYFQDSKSGYAIEILNPIQFDSPVAVSELRKKVSVFSAPQSFLLLGRDSRLNQLLSSRIERASGNVWVSLRPIKADEEKRFISLVTKEIGSKYDEITQGFAKSLLETNKLGVDPRGILTESKEVLTICDEKGNALGFTTLTYKTGGSVKTGPTILFSKNRRKGYGSATRAAIEEHVKTKKGVRKLYCTCPDDDEAVLRYILKAGYTVEAHLKSHYHKNHGELVLGKFVYPPKSPSESVAEIGQELCSVESVDAFPQAELKKLTLQLARTKFPKITAEQVRKILDRANSDINTPIENKPLRVFCLKRGTSCKGLLLLIPKRGGAIKGLIFSETTNESTLKEILKRAEDFVREATGRKIYFLSSVDSVVVNRFLRSQGYFLEGALKEPYKPGDDVLILSRFF
jgi:predicted transcriptional regulator